MFGVPLTLRPGQVSAWILAGSPGQSALVAGPGLCGGGELLPPSVGPRPHWDHRIASRRAGDLLAEWRPAVSPLI